MTIGAVATAEGVSTDLVVVSAITRVESEETSGEGVTGVGVRRYSSRISSMKKEKECEAG